MQLTDEQVLKVARLARIHISDADVAQLRQDLSQVLNWVETLNEVDTENVDPMFSVHLEQMPMRQDVVNDGNKVNDILKNAPETKHNMFVVPKVVE